MRGRDLGSPSTLRRSRVNGFSGGGELDEGEDNGDSEDSEENPDGESPGVSASGSAILTVTSTSLSSSGSCNSGALSCDKCKRYGFRLHAPFGAVSEVSEWEDADDSSNVRFGDLCGRGSRSELMLGIIRYGDGVGRDDGGSEEPAGGRAGDGEREEGVSAIFTGFSADLRSLR